MQIGPVATGVPRPTLATSGSVRGQVDLRACLFRINEMSLVVLECDVIRIGQNSRRNSEQNLKEIKLYYSVASKYLSNVCEILQPLTFILEH